MLRKFKYQWLKRNGKGVLREYVEKVSGYSRSQVARLVGQYQKSGRIRVNIQDDLKEKLTKRLGAFGKVTLGITLTNGKSYQIIRTYDGDNNSIETINTEDGGTYQGDILSLFPILAYSQNEVIKIAEDEDAHLTLIDSFIDSSQYSDEIIKLKKELEFRDKELAKSIKAAAYVASLQKDFNTILERLKNIDVSLNNALFVEMKSLEKKKAIIEKHIALHEDLCGKM